MATDDDRRIDGDDLGLSAGSHSMDDAAIRDLAMREVLGLLDEPESADLEQAFASMTPDEQAAILDLQAAVARELAGAGSETPDRSLRYQVLARLTQEMETDVASAGPLAVIGARSVDRSFRGTGSRSAMAGPITELQFDRVSRSAAVWRAATFALGSAVLALAALTYRSQNVTRTIVDRLGDQVISQEIIDLVGEQAEIAAYFRSSTAVFSPLASATDDISMSGLLCREARPTLGGKFPATLLGFSFPARVGSIRIVAIETGGRLVDLGTFNTDGRAPFAAFPVELASVDLAGAVFEIRDGETGSVLMRTAVAV